MILVHVFEYGAVQMGEYYRNVFIIFVRYYI